MHYEKFKRVAQAWSIVAVAAGGGQEKGDIAEAWLFGAVAAAVRQENGHIGEARIGLTNMGPTPLRAGAAEAALAGVDATDEAIAAAAAHAPDGTSPSMELNAQRDSRQHLAQVLTRRAVRAAAGL